MAEYHALVKVSIQSLAAKAFKTQTNLLMAKSEMVRYMAAKDILDRAGYKPTEKIEAKADIYGEVVVHRVDLSGLRDEQLSQLDEIANKIDPP